MKIGIIGVGNMGSAIARALVKAEPGLRLNLLNRTPEKIRDLVTEVGGQQFLMTELEDFIQQSEIIFIGVKPKDLPPLFDRIRPFLSEDMKKTWISLAVGISLDRLIQLTPENHGWIRMMPNTPIEVGQGFISYCPSPQQDQQVLESIIHILSQSSQCLELGEDYFDIGGAIAGSGPAFVYLMIEAMADAGLKHGLSKDTAIMMAAKTFQGAASMVLETDSHPSLLKDQVTSPAGTTIEGLLCLEETAVKANIIHAIDRVVDKSKQI